MVQYLEAILKHSPTWAAVRLSTGEYVEFNPIPTSTEGLWTEWTYHFPHYNLERHYVTLEDWEREIWCAAEAEDWEPVIPAPLIAYGENGKDRVEVLDAAYGKNGKSKVESIPLDE